MNIKFTDNTDKWLTLFQAATYRGLEKVGLTAENYAKKLCPVDTGNLRNSITHQIFGGEKTVVIGTNVGYGKYVEFGTGSGAEGSGRPGSWVYQDEKGIWHRTSGMKAQPFLRPAAKNHGPQYREILEKELEKG